MKQTLLIATIMLLTMGCAGNKPAEQAFVIENKCKDFEHFDSLVVNSLKMPEAAAWNGEEFCPCYELIVCNEIEYCISFKCSNGKITPIF